MDEVPTTYRHCAGGGQDRSEITVQWRHPGHTEGWMHSTVRVRNRGLI